MQYFKAMILPMVGLNAAVANADSHPSIDTNCGLVNVMSSNVMGNFANALGDKTLDHAWSVSVAGDVFENEHKYIGMANFEFKWTPNPDYRDSRCPQSNGALILQTMYDEHVSRCANFVQTGTFDMPFTMKRSYNGCGCGELIHTDLRNGIKYNDKWAEPGFAACAGKDKLFAVKDVTPLIVDFCADFAAKASVVEEGARMLRTTKNVAYEIEPLFNIDPPHGDEAPEKKSADLNVFAAFDEKACPALPETRVWPSKGQCEVNLRAAIEASGDVSMCSYECSLSHNKEGIWELDYCQNFHPPSATTTTGGYKWADCFRWGVVSNLKEGILGSVVLDL